MKRSSTRKKMMLGLGIILVLIFVSSCASMRASSARGAYIDQMTEKHVYNMSCEQVWPAARSLLFTEGYSVRDTGEGTNMTLETEWRVDASSSTTSSTTTNTSRTQSRYLVQGMQPDEGQCKVNFSKNERQNRNINSMRDLDLEWRLLQQVAPQVAAEIAQEAEVRANAAAQG